MIPFIISLLGSVVVAEVYEKYIHPTQKVKWQNFTKMHHGEAGAIMTVTSLITKSPTLLGSGIGLMFHDKNDANKWFKR